MQTVLWRALAEIYGCNDADRSAGSGPWNKGVRHGGVRAGDVIAFPDVQVKAYRNSVYMST